MFKAKWLIVAATAVLVSACASGPQIRTNQDPQVELSAYRTFGFFEPSPSRAGYQPLIGKRLKLAAAQELERFGYVYDERNPQLRVGLFLRIADKQQVRSAPGGARAGRYVGLAGYPQEIETVDYKAGTLAIDLVDMSRRALVWRGVAEGKVPEQAMRDPGAAIDQVVASMFRNFPAAPVK